MLRLVGGCGDEGRAWQPAWQQSWLALQAAWRRRRALERFSTWDHAMSEAPVPAPYLPLTPPSHPGPCPPFDMQAGDVLGPAAQWLAGGGVLQQLAQAHRAVRGRQAPIQDTHAGRPRGDAKMLTMLRRLFRLLNNLCSSYIPYFISLRCWLECHDGEAVMIKVSLPR